MKKIFTYLLSLIFPTICGFCGKINDSPICEDCLNNLEQIKKSNIQVYNSNNFFFQEHFYLFDYKDEIRDKIIQYKFQEKSYLFHTFSTLFITDSNFQNFIKNYDYIISVPLHKQRLKVRGYNQSELIAKEIAKHFNIRYCKDLLLKKNYIPAQSTLTRLERQQNVQNAFSLNVKKLQPEFLSNCNFSNIAIFDDIFTTGATANECAKALKQLGFKKIGIITIAKD